MGLAPTPLPPPNPIAIHNERTKLMAGALNTLGLAFAIGGFVGPAINGRLLGWGALVPVAWFVLGAALHVCAQALLGRLR